MMLHPIPRLTWMLAFLFVGPSAASASDGWQWLGGRDAVFTITTIDAKQKAFSVAEHRSAIRAWTESIRRERATGGTTAATFPHFRPGVRVRIYGGVVHLPLASSPARSSSSPTNELDRNA